MVRIHPGPPRNHLKINIIIRNGFWLVKLFFIIGSTQNGEALLLCRLPLSHLDAQYNSATIHAKIFVIDFLIMANRLWLFLLVTFVSGSAYALELAGKVRIVDVATNWIGKTKIRLHGLDALKKGRCAKLTH